MRKLFHKKNLLVLVTLVLAIALTGCGEKGGHKPPVSG